jgi:hypothetical protein
MDEKPEPPRRLSMIDVAAVVLIGLFAIGVLAWIIYTIDAAFHILPG